MGESLHCDICGKPATVHLTQIVKNQIQKVDLCEECAQTKGVTDPEGFSLADLLSKSFAGPSDESPEEASDPATMVCEQCGSSARDFKKTGRLGCALCYETLKPVLLPLIAGLHKGVRHKGKAPHRQWRRLELSREIESLERQLLNAVKEENFESASRFRDQLGVLRAKLEAPTATT